MVEQITRPCLLDLKRRARNNVVGRETALNYEATCHVPVQRLDVSLPLRTFGSMYKRP